MTKEEVAKLAAEQILRDVYTLQSQATDQIAEIIVDAITRYIRATVPEGPVSKEQIETLWKDLIAATQPLHLSSRINNSRMLQEIEELFDRQRQHIDHLERQVVFLMDEGNVYEQGRLAAKREWEDREKELVRALQDLEWKGFKNGFRYCPMCGANGGDTAYQQLGHKSHLSDCRLALAIGAKRRE